MRNHTTLPNENDQPSAQRGSLVWRELEQSIVARINRHLPTRSTKNFPTIFLSRSRAPWVVVKMGSTRVGSLNRPPCWLILTVLLQLRVNTTRNSMG